jgi:hypothetical protein
MSKAREIQDGRKAMIPATEAAQRAIESVIRSNQIKEFVGAAKVMNKLAITLSSQVLLGLKHFQEQEGYKEYGCKTFVEFLEQHPELDLSKSKYYRLSEALETEGPDAFDLLNGLNIPLSSRKKLGTGAIQIEGDDLVINDQRVPLDDPKRIKRAISQVVAEVDKATSKASKAEKENEKLKKKLEQAVEEARAAAIIPRDDTDPANQAYLRVIASLTELTRELGELSQAEAAERLKLYRPHIAQAVEFFMQFTRPEAPTRRPDNTTGLSDEDLADLMED